MEDVAETSAGSRAAHGHSWIDTRRDRTSFRVLSDNSGLQTGHNDPETKA